MPEGIDAHEIPAHWIKGERKIVFPETPNPNYEITGEALEWLLREAGYEPDTGVGLYPDAIPENVTVDPEWELAMVQDKESRETA